MYDEQFKLVFGTNVSEQHMRENMGNILKIFYDTFHPAKLEYFLDSNYIWKQLRILGLLGIGMD